MMVLNFAAISAGATGVRSAASEAKAKAVQRIHVPSSQSGAVFIPQKKISRFRSISLSWLS